MKSSVSSILIQRAAVTVVIAVRLEQFRVDSLNDLTVRPIPTAGRIWACQL